VQDSEETLFESRLRRDELGFAGRKPPVEFNGFFLNGDLFCFLFYVVDKKGNRTAMGAVRKHDKRAEYSIRLSLERYL
jgi:hypothetical protein